MRRSHPALRAFLFALLAVQTASVIAQEFPPEVRERIASRLHKTLPATELQGELGSEGNPVRVLLPDGEREYLARLRCDDGTQPRHERNGSNGFGPYDRILDAYTVTCDGAEPKVVQMDMYHCVEETQAIAGFSIVPEIGHRDRSICD